MTSRSRLDVGQRLRAHLRGELLIVLALDAA